MFCWEKNYFKSHMTRKRPHVHNSQTLQVKECMFFWRCLLLSMQMWPYFKKKTAKGGGLLCLTENRGWEGEGVRLSAEAVWYSVVLICCWSVKYRWLKKRKSRNYYKLYVRLVCIVRKATVAFYSRETFS